MSEGTPAPEAVSSAGAADVVARVVDNLGLAVRAKRETLELCVLGLLAEGHLIIEDFPGVGKTVLAKSLARSLHLSDLRRAVGEELGLDGRSFAEAAGRARFGPPDAARRDADVARQEVRALLRRMRSELSVWARLRGFVSLRSLRGGWQA